jgi:uncharacterized repeat protein (TIGR01451 family)
VAGPGSVIPGHGTLFGAQLNDTNAAGVLFTGGAGSNLGLIYWNGTSYTLIAPRVSSGSNSINDLGVATWETDGRLLKGSGGTPTVVASALAGGGYQDISVQAISDAGQVVFLARAPSATFYGVYSGPNPVADKILGPGDIVPGLGTVRGVNMGTMAINDAGQIAMAVLYDPGDGSTKRAIVRADPVIAPSTDLALQKTASPNTVLPSGMLTYTLTLTNAGSETASSVLVTDTLPGTVTFTSCAATNGGVCGGGRQRAHDQLRQPRPGHEFDDNDRGCRQCERRGGHSNFQHRHGDQRHGRSGAGQQHRHGERVDTDPDARR